MKKISSIKAKAFIMVLAVVALTSTAFMACHKNDDDPAVTLQLKVVTAASAAGFQVNSTLVMGNKDAILIDAQFTIADADSLVKIIQDSKKNLTTIYITHSHADHYFGLVELKKAFPNVKIVALPSTVTDIRNTYKDRLTFWKGFVGDAITSSPIFPEAMSGTTLTLEGQTLQIVGGLQGDEGLNSYVWIPSIKAIICGDIDYNGVFPYTIETTPAQRTGWANSISSIQALKPEIVVAGHKNPTLKDDATSLEFTKGYLAFYDSVLPTATSSADFQTKIKAKYTTLNLPIILQLAADALF